MTLPPAKLPAPTEAQDDVANALHGGLRRVRKHWPIVAACVLVAGGIGLVYSKSLPRIYEAQAMVEVDPSAQNPLSESKGEGPLALGNGDYFDNQEYYETQYRIITSSPVMERAARDAGLTSDFAFFGLSSPPARPMTAQQAGLALRGHVIVEPVKNSRLVNVKVDDVDPKRAKRLADAVANAYIDQNLEKALSATGDSVTWLGGQVDHVKRDLETSEDALHLFKEKNDLPSTSINESSNMLRQELQDLNTALTHTRTRKQELMARYAELSKVNSDNPDVLPASELLSSAYLQELRGHYVTALQAKRGLAASGKGENHPEMKAADERVSEARSALLAEVRNIQGSVERDLAVVNHEESGEAELYEAAHKKAVDLGMKEIEYHRLDRSREQNEKLYALLIEHLKEADLARMMKANNIHLVEAALEPTAPIRPRVSMNVAISLLLGFLAGLGLVWLRDGLDSSLKTPEDVEQVLGVTFLGLLPSSDPSGSKTEEQRVRRRRLAHAPEGQLPRELVVHEYPHSGIAEAARSIRTNLLFTNPDKPFRKLLVSSAAPSEGKTTVACSIAIALAQSGQRVCIVDCDLRRPRLHRIFDRAGDAGVTNALVGGAAIDEVAKPTQIENLWCIPSGPIPPNPADLLHSDRFRRFLAELSEVFDRVVIDSPPLVAVTDAAIISTQCDGTVFVLRAFQTTRALARQGMRTLADVDAPVVGGVLNAVDLNRHEYSYYQYYYYKREGYGTGESAPAEEGAAPPPAS